MTPRSQVTYHVIAAAFVMAALPVRAQHVAAAAARRVAPTRPHNWATQERHKRSIAQDERGLVYFRHRRYAAAERAFLAACKLDPTDGAPETHLALLLEDQRRYGEEESAFRDLVKLASAHPAQHYWLGKALVNEKQYRAAVPELRKAIALAPDRWVYHYFLAAALKGAGDAAGSTAERATSERLRKSHPVETP